MPEKFNYTTIAPRFGMDTAHDAFAQFIHTTFTKNEQPAYPDWLPFSSTRLGQYQIFDGWNADIIIDPQNLCIRIKPNENEAHANERRYHGFEVQPYFIVYLEKTPDYDRELVTTLPAYRPKAILSLNEIPIREDIGDETVIKNEVRATDLFLYSYEYGANVPSAKIEEQYIPSLITRQESEGPTPHRREVQVHIGFDTNTVQMNVKHETSSKSYSVSMKAAYHSDKTLSGLEVSARAHAPLQVGPYMTAASQEATAHLDKDALRDLMDPIPGVPYHERWRYRDGVFRYQLTSSESLPKAIIEHPWFVDITVPPALKQIGWISPERLADPMGQLPVDDSFWTNVDIERLGFKISAYFISGDDDPENFLWAY